MKLLIIGKESIYTNKFISFFNNQSIKVHQNDSLIDSIDQLYKGLYDVVVILIDKKINKELEDFMKIITDEGRNLVVIPIIEDDYLSMIDQIPGHLYFSTTTKFEIIRKNMMISFAKKIMVSNKYYVVADGIIIDINNLSIRDTSGRKENLTRTEARILDILITNKEKSLTREEIIKLSGLEKLGKKGERSIDVHIKNIRGKLMIDSILSVRGIGYRWIDRN